MSATVPLPELPITEVLADIRQALSDHQELILEAPPGAGKTTLVPLALLHENWLDNNRIVMLQPRRMAARAAAQRMASLLGEKTGETVGYRIRQETQISAQTRIEVLTEGILNRMLLDDPALTGISLIIFDEFHERSLDADSGLALALQGRELFRDENEPLRILLMSATLNGEALSQLLPKAPIIRSEGRMFPVETHYGQPYRYGDDVVAKMVATIAQASLEHQGNILAFLPGQGEILRAQSLLQEKLSAGISILPLYGSLPLQQQQQALETTQPGQRKIVLATDIAETSLTIEGISVVVDSGLCRLPEFDPTSGMTRLHTRRISQDSATQRAGRAGRISAGHCYRLWSEEQQLQLSKHRSPEILQADLAPLLLQLLSWGVDNLRELSWLNPPPIAATQQALELLQSLGAIKQQQSDPTENDDLSSWRLTNHGMEMARLPTHPRLAHMLIAAHQQQLTDSACAMAALLTERNPLQNDYGSDLSLHLAVVLGETRCHSRHQNWLQRTRQQAKQFRKLLHASTIATTEKPQSNIDEKNQCGYLIACAYPERIARRKNEKNCEYQLAMGQFATLDHTDPLQTSQWLAVAEMGGIKRQGESRQQLRIFSAVPFDPILLEDSLHDLVNETEIMQWDEKTQRFLAEQQSTLGKLTISSRPITNISPKAKTDALIALIKKQGLSLLPWNEQIYQWQARVELLRNLAIPTINQQTNDSNPWPDVSNEALLKTLTQWLAPYLININKLDDLKKLDLSSILAALLPWPLPKTLEETAPQKITVPSGSSYNIDYLQNPPVLRVKLQEMFGCATTPAIANGKVKLMLHLLSPAQRPLQVTQDLAGFWQSSYFEVQKEMKGRYPKHPWPDNPMEAQATRFTKSRQ